MKRGKVNVLIDGQWGSTGKGKMAGYLATKHKIDVVTFAAQPQAGHTHVGENGMGVVGYHIPISGIVGGEPLIILNAGSTIDIDKLIAEIDRHDVGDRIVIHPHAAVVSSADKERESKDCRVIASTMQGTGAATARKVMRTANVAKDYSELQHFCRKYDERAVQKAVEEAKMVLCETTQGFDLSLSFGQYPYCTSREITTSQALAFAGVPPQAVGDVYGVLRTFPIRVGNIDGGFSGPCYPDQKEVDWSTITKASGSLTPIEERTTVTNRIRRVFTFSHLQVLRFCRMCAPDYLFVNFVNYINAEDEGVDRVENLSKETIDFLRGLQSQLNSDIENPPTVMYAGTGARVQDMVVFS